jgi:hypothetical protein
MRLNPSNLRLLPLLLLASVAMVAGCQESGTTSSGAGSSSETAPLVADETSELVKVSVTGAT